MAAAAKAVGIDGLVLLRGDPPLLGDALPNTAEDAAKAIRSHVPGLRLGALISMRRGLAEIAKRVESNLFDFFLVLRATEAPEQRLEEVAKLAHRRGFKLYGYVIVASKIPEQLKGQPIVRVEDARYAVERLLNVLDGVVVSVPEGLRKLLEIVRRVVSGLDA
jgi:hypothetical protein